MEPAHEGATFTGQSLQGILNLWYEVVGSLGPDEEGLLVMNSDHCDVGSEKVVPTSCPNQIVIPADSGMFMVVHLVLFQRYGTQITD